MGQKKQGTVPVKKWEWGSGSKSHGNRDFLGGVYKLRPNEDLPFKK